MLQHKLDKPVPSFGSLWPGLRAISRFISLMVAEGFCAASAIELNKERSKKPRQPGHNPPNQLWNLKLPLFG